MEKSYTEKLARFIYFAIILGLVLIVCWYFRSILGYAAIATVIALISRPISDLIGKIHIKGRPVPLAARNLISSLIILLAVFAALSGLVPVMVQLVTNFTEIVSQPADQTINGYLDSANSFIIRSFPLVGKKFKLSEFAFSQLNELADISLFRTLLGSLASTVAGIAVAVFIIVFISYFFIKDRYLLRRFICAIAPDSIEEKVGRAIGECGHLLSRYFAGLALEMTIVGLIDFLGLWAFARLDFTTALGIGFMAGLLNIIPYLGPWIGAALGSVTAVVLTLNGGAVMAGGSIWAYVLILLAVFLVAQLVDNYLLQPLIYSKSIKASPLEIFFVILLAGSLGGVIGMLVAIPAYTVLRVFAINIFPDNKFVRFLEA